jgi:hypothetical protein
MAIWSSICGLGWNLAYGGFVSVVGPVLGFASFPDLSFECCPALFVPRFLFSIMGLLNPVAPNAGGQEKRQRIDRIRN